MTAQNDLAPDGQIALDTADAPPTAANEDASRLPPLRIVHVNNIPAANGGRDDKPRAWHGTPIRPHPILVKQDAMLDRALQARIGGMLRDVFSDVADAPVPDRFVKLLEQLEAKENPGE